MSALKRKIIDTFLGHPQPSRGWSAVEKLVKDRIQEAKAEAWDKGYAEGWNERDDAVFWPLNPYRKESQ